ncbi:MAG: radical SAM protein [Candidatus Omnitrophica bacterium]|nr:radical SAM protein [Candidatus Omnitrophota bacterium]
MPKAFEKPSSYSDLASLKKSPSLVVAGPEGEMLDIPELAATVRWGREEIVPDHKEWGSMPDGSDLYLMPGRKPVGYDRRTGERVVVESYEGVPVTAVSAFVAPAYTIHFHSNFETEEDAPDLPLYAYCAVAWEEGDFVVPVERVDSDHRQDCDQFDPEEVHACTFEMIAEMEHNRLAQHLMRNCVLTYNCPAARNFALGRWEMPIPSSAVCNSRCFGCISKQPKEDGFHESQYRLDFIPSVDEIVEITVPHLEYAPRPVASFGQGCEGEPLTNPELLEETCRKIREKTPKGTLNMNTNGSKPEVIRKLFHAGLDSIRVSLNSPIESRYNAYYKPVDYTLDDVIQSLHVAKAMEKWSSINYLVFPGVTDTPSEIRALLEMVFDTGLSMIQWRNLNIDPEAYLDLLGEEDLETPLGMRWAIEKVHSHFPKIRKGYYNPPVGRRAWKR